MTDTLQDVTGSDYYRELATRPAARAPATLGEVWQSEWTRGGLDTYFGLQKPLDDSVTELESAIAGAAGKPAQDYARERGLDLGRPATIDQRIKMLGDLADTFDDDTRKKIEPLRDARARAADKAQAIERAASDVAAGTYGLSGTATAFLAGMARQFVDPAVIAANIATGPLGGPFKGPLLSVVARQGIAGMAGQALVEPAIEGERERLGLEAGAGRAAQNIVEAGLGSAGLAVLFRGAAWTARRAITAVRGEPALAPDARTSAPEFRPGEPGIEAAPAPADRPGMPASDLAPEDFQAATHVAERDELVAAHAPEGVVPDAHATRLEDTARAIEERRPLPTDEGAVDTPAPTRRGPAARDPATFSVFEFLASHGGLHPTDKGGLTGELAGILDRNPFVPGFGPLLRKGGMSLDRAWEALVEAGYIHDEGMAAGRVNTSSINDVLALIDEEGRGNRQYRPGNERPEKIDPAEHRAKLEQFRVELAGDFDARMAEVGLADMVNKAERKRALQIMEREGERDALAAYERALLERTDRQEARRVARQQVTEPIPGWDIDERVAAPRDGESAARADGPRPGSEGTGGTARDAGGGDREALAAKLGDPELAREVERILADNPDAEIYVTDADGNPVKLTARDALIEAQDDARAVAELDDCIGVTSNQEPPF